MLEINKNYVINASQQTVAVQIPISEFEQIESALKVIEDETTSTALDIEKDIIVPIPPLSQREIKLKVKHLGRAKPRVVYNPLPLSQEPCG
jgi:trans-2-enoyl-CoA reductase